MKTLHLLLFLAVSFPLPLKSQGVLSARLIASGFTVPTSLVSYSSQTFLVGEKAGLVKWIDLDAGSAPVTLLDIRSQVESRGFEQGLFGLALHPSFPDSNYLYVSYTNRQEDLQVSRFSITASSGLMADPGSQKVILYVDKTNDSHNAGDLVFGADGLLYISVGDGAVDGDPFENGQNPGTLLGNILRIDVDGGDPYTIPAGNPFSDRDSLREEIWAWGLRNPWRISFDRSTGDLWVADVGQFSWEEINHLPDGKGGVNFGWDCFEGDAGFEPDDCLSADSFVFPVCSYSHGKENGCSVTGGYVYRGNKMSSFRGHYIFADWCSGRFRSLRPDGESGWLDAIVMDEGIRATTFGEDENGELYVAGQNGGLYLLEEAVTAVVKAPTISKLKVYPNPAGDHFRLSLRVNRQAEFFFWLLDNSGRPLNAWSQTIQGQYDRAVSLEDLPAGRYTLLVEEGGRRLTRTILKAR